MTRTTGRSLASLIVLAMSCGSYKGTGSSVTLVTNRKSVVLTQTLLGGYVPKAARLSIVDTGLKSEVFVSKETLPEGEWAVTVDSLSGLARVRSDSVTVIAAEGRQDLSLGSGTTSSRDQVGVAPVGTSLAFPRTDGFRILRYLGVGDGWQNESIGVSGQSDTPSLTWSDDGKRLFILDKDESRFHIFGGEDVTKRFAAHPISCATNSTSVISATASAFVAQSGTVLLGAKVGKVYWRDGIDSSACASPAAWKSLTLSSTSDVLAIGCESSGTTCLVGTKEDGMFALKRTSTSADWTSTHIDGSCAFPLSWATMKDEKLIVLCSSAMFQPTTSVSLMFNLQFLDPKSGKELGTLSLPDAPALIALDREKAEVNLLMNRGVGVLWQWSPDAAKVSKFEGLFLNDVL